MTVPQAGSILHHLRRAALRQGIAPLTDGQLLRSFLDRRDESAFEALVRRHGPMVRGVCRRILCNAADADDAFQASFLVLLRKAPALAAREVLGDWLHGVAYRTALKARTLAARRRLKERQAPLRKASEETDSPEWAVLLDREVGRLPEKYRLPVVLCDLQGHSHKEAARQLGWPEGSLSGRLSRARAMLARRLTQQGVVLPAGALALGLAGEASARLPLPLVNSTCRAARSFAAGSAAGAVPAHVATLTEGVMRSMLLAKLKVVGVLLVGAITLAVGFGAWRQAVSAGPTEEPREEKKAPAPKDVRKAAPLPALPRNFQIDLILSRGPDSKRKTVEGRLRTVEGRVATFGTSFATKKEFELPVGNGKVEPMHWGPVVRVVVHSEERGKICLDMTLNHPTVGYSTTDDVSVMSESVRVIRKTALGKPETAKLDTGGKHSTPLEVTAIVRESQNDSQTPTIADAERDLKTAEFYRRTGHPNSARFYYEIICRRYSDTIYAERAKKRLAALKKEADKADTVEEKPPARVGQIFIIGNSKIADVAILEQVPLFPGQILTYPDLDLAKQNLSRLKGLKRPPKVTAIDREGHSVYRDIQITVEEK